jgi:hypothetical protein
MKRLKKHESDYRAFQAGKKKSKLTSYKILENKNYTIELIKLLGVCGYGKNSKTE